MLKGIIVGGFGMSGSGAVIDLLREVSVCEVIDTELRMLVDPDGILSLEDGLVHSWTPYQSDLAIKRFKRLIGKLSNRYSSPYLTLDHRSHFGSGFEDISEEYIRELTTTSFNGTWYGINNFSMTAGSKLNKTFRRRLYPFFKKMYLASPGGRFYDISREYLQKLLLASIKREGTEYVVIDEGYASMNPVRVLRFFDGGKIIVAHRDPRDIYIDSLCHRYFVPQDAETFVLWFESLMTRYALQNKQGDVLEIFFEDLVLDYERTVDDIFNFLSIDKSAHGKKREIFQPKKSSKNVMMWKSRGNESACELIKSRLGEYCYGD